MLTKFIGYAVDCLVEGDFDLTRAHLREQLNDQDEIVVLNATLTRLTDASRLGAPRVILEQEELRAVEVGPAAPAGSERLHAVRHRRRGTWGRTPSWVTSTNALA